VFRAFNNDDAGSTFKGVQVCLVCYITYGIDFDDLLPLLLGNPQELDVSMP
tara:strand:+ start:576 stop:728 length:153 start_codon:yes stop_codon:yes gene_type:complete